MRQRALVTGIGGQDGSLLAELLLERGYEVYGLVRRPVSARYENLEGIRDRIELIQADLLDQLALVEVLRGCRPHEVYNLESPRRPLDFLPSKVANAAASISLGLAGELWLGDLDARRDWGYAGDYVRAMWLMLQQKAAEDYVIASGELHSVREFVELAFEHVGLDWERYVQIDQSLRRGAAELHDLVGDASKARRELGWEPAVRFPELVRLLVEAELERLRGAPTLTSS